MKLEQFYKNIPCFYTIITAMWYFYDDLLFNLALCCPFLFLEFEYRLCFDSYRKNVSRLMFLKDIFQDVPTLKKKKRTTKNIVKRTA